MKSHKPLTYNRFRAYLRFKLKNQHFSKKRFLFAILFYFLCSLTLFLLPLDILTRYPYLKHFTDFMDFIPAIKLMESKTYAPELCKFYASYMLVVGAVCFVVILRDFFVYCANGMLRPYSKKGVQTLGGVGKMVKNPKKVVAWCLLTIAITILFFNGDLVGSSTFRFEDEYFIYNLYEMLWYIIFRQGGIVFANIIAIILALALFDVFKHYAKKGER